MGWVDIEENHQICAIAIFVRKLIAWVILNPHFAGSNGHVFLSEIPSACISDFQWVGAGVAIYKKP